MINKSSVDEELATITALLASTEKSFQRAFFEFIAVATSVEVLKIIRQYLEQGRYDEIVDFVNTLSKPLGRTVYNAVVNAGDVETKILEPKAQIKANAKIPKGLSKPKVMLTFDPGNPRAAEIIRDQTESLIRDISESTRQVINDAIFDGLTTGKNPRAIAKEIQSVIGLTRFQENAVKNYRRLLEAGSKEALNRALRDKRYSEDIKNLSQDQIDRMVDAYRRKYINYRAETIARTEAGKAISQAQEEALRQTMSEVGFTDDEVIRTWRSTKDMRTRDTHVTLDGQKRPLNVPFTSSSGARLRYPRDPSAPASEVCNCRCTLTTQFV